LPDAPTQVGVLQPTAIGDTILSSGFFPRLRACYPAASITLFHGPSNQAGMDLLPNVFQPVICNLTDVRNA